MDPHRSDSLTNRAVRIGVNHLQICGWVVPTDIDNRGRETSVGTGLDTPGVFDMFPHTYHVETVLKLSGPTP